MYEGIRSVGTIARFVEFLAWNDKPQLQVLTAFFLSPRLWSYMRINLIFLHMQFETASALTNLASGRSEQTQVIIEYGAVPRLVRLLISPREDGREQVGVWLSALELHF